MLDDSLPPGRAFIFSRTRRQATALQPTISRSVGGSFSEKRIVCFRRHRSIQQWPLTDYGVKRTLVDGPAGAGNRIAAARAAGGDPGSIFSLFFSSGASAGCRPLRVCPGSTVARRSAERMDAKRTSRWSRCPASGFGARNDREAHYCKTPLGATSSRDGLDIVSIHRAWQSMGTSSACHGPEAVPPPPSAASDRWRTCSTELVSVPEHADQGRARSS